MNFGNLYSKMTVFFIKFSENTGENNIEKGIFFYFPVIL